MRVTAVRIRLDHQFVHLMKGVLLPDAPVNSRSSSHSSLVLVDLVASLGYLSPSVQFR